MSNYHIGQTLTSKFFPGHSVEVVATEPINKGVTVLATTGERVNTTERYLSALYVSA